VLFYFKKCAGPGRVATLFKNGYPGRLGIDRHGNLVPVDGGQRFRVYRDASRTARSGDGPFR
jgi:hypothetical protein